MASSVSKLLASVDKFDGTNWDDWSYSIRSAFHLSHILWIAEGKEACPTAAIPSVPTEAEIKAIDDWERCNDEGVGLIQLAIKTTIQSS